MRYYKFIFLLLLIAMVSACADLGIKPINYPTVSLSSLQLLSASLSEQSYEIQLEIDNPNAFPLPLTTIDYELKLNDAVFAEGTNAEAVTIPANQAEVIKLQVTSNLVSLYEQARAFGSSILGGDFGSELDYELKGSLSFAEGLLDVPYDYSGKVSVSNIIDNSR